MATTYSKQQLRAYAYFAFLIIPLSGMCIDVYVPSLPNVAMALHTTKTAAQMTIAVFSLGLAIGQFIAGPISDRFGRKPIITLGCCSQIIVLALIILFENINTMLFLRCIQGLAVAFMVVPGRAIIADLFAGDEFKKKINSLTIFWALGTIVSPALGGYLQHYFKWQASFFFMLFYTLIIGMMLFFFRETIKQKTPLRPATLLKNYRQIVQGHFFLLGTLLTGLIASFIILFNVVCPFIVQITLHHSAIDYGHIALFMGLAWFLGNSLNRLMFTISLRIKTITALLLLIIVTLIMLNHSLTSTLSIESLAIPSFIIIFCGASIFPNIIGESLAPFRHLAGSANALLFSGMWFSGYVFSSIGAFLPTRTLTPLALTYCLTGCFALIIFMLYMHCLGRHNNTSAS